MFVGLKILREDTSKSGGVAIGSRNKQEEVPCHRLRWVAELVPEAQSQMTKLRTGSQN